MNYWDKRGVTIDVDAFRVDVGVLVNMTEREAERWVKKRCKRTADIEAFCKELNEWDTHTGADGQMLKLGGGFVILLRTRKGQFYDFLGTLTHEMVHVTQYLLRDRRTPLNEDTEEVHAYLTEYLVKTSLRKLCN